MVCCGILAELLLAQPPATRASVVYDPAGSALADGHER